MFNNGCVLLAKSLKIGTHGSVTSRLQHTPAVPTRAGTGRVCVSVCWTSEWVVCVPICKWTQKNPRYFPGLTLRVPDVPVRQVCAGFASAEEEWEMASFLLWINRQVRESVRNWIPRNGLGWRFRTFALEAPCPGTLPHCVPQGQSGQAQNGCRLCSDDRWTMGARL